ncbi:hypothetical protein SAMN05443247_11453 [Bradyrhizobium erythrophlei]|jgi:hypothetical protein|nr:hypothetical protein SAMN05443247_11453 [Bradyrhizobium erythrophlei]
MKIEKLVYGGTLNKNALPSESELRKRAFDARTRHLPANGEVSLLGREPRLRVIVGEVDEVGRVHVEHDQGANEVIQAHRPHAAHPGL